MNAIQKAILLCGLVVFVGIGLYQALSWPDTGYLRDRHLQLAAWQDINLGAMLICWLVTGVATAALVIISASPPGRE